MEENKQKVKKFNFWHDHSTTYLEMAYRRDKTKRIENPDGYGRRKGECGDIIEMFINLDEEKKIKTVSFVAQGCLNTNACANTVACLAEKKTIEEAWKITPEYIIKYLETLPSDDTHCAELAVGAFYLALSKCQEIKRSPWKKFYGNP